VKLQPWKTLSSRDILRDRWIRLRADRCEVAPGRIIESYYVMEEPEWVHVIALDPGQRVLLVRQYRHAIGAFSWELPGGNADVGETLLATAQRELLEETGAVGEAWQHVGGYVTNPGRHNNRVQGFLAQNVRVIQPTQFDENELIEVGTFTIAEVLALIRTQEFSNVMHVALFYRALDVLGLMHIGPKPTP
jgi:8-oxo-dGTP pyrophosphatase MutT (NUDIX family)